MSEDLKKCTKCKNSYPSTTDFYYKIQNKNKIKNVGKLKLSSWCKRCFIDSRREFQKKNYNEGEQKLKKYHKELRLRDGDRIRKREREYSRRHKEMRAEYQSLWQKTESGKDKSRKYRIDREQHKKHDINNLEWENCKEYFDYCCAYCGMPIEIHREKMKKDFAKEHAINLGANDLSNCIPSCFYCNSEKSISDYMNWFNEDNDNFSKERLDKILKWLQSDYLKYMNIERNTKF